MTRKNYVIVSTTGLVLFLISIPWFLLVKGHLMLEPPYFRVDPRFTQSAEPPEVMLADRVTTDAAANRLEVVKKPTTSVQLINLPAVRVGALANVAPSTPRAATQKTPATQPAEAGSAPVSVSPPRTTAAPVQRQEAVLPETSHLEPRVPPTTEPTEDLAVVETADDATSRYGIQVAAFTRQAYAKKYASQHENTGTEVHIVKRRIAGKTWYRVILGSYANKDEAMVFDRILQQVLGDTETQLVQFTPQSSRKGKVDSP